MFRAAVFLLLLASLFFPLRGLSQGPLVGHPGEVVFIPAAPGELRARFLGHAFSPVLLGSRAYFPIAIPLRTSPGIFRVEIEGSAPRRVSLEVRPKRYPTEHLKLPPKMVTFPPEILARIRREVKLIRGVLSRHGEGLCRWEKGFILPVKGRVSSPFGLRRVLNGESRSPHGGVDLAVPSGTPVRAAQEGRVVLVGEFYLPGKALVLDHGCGVYTYYAHLSRILVRKGQRVRRGEVIALSGASGRATGPHLHFGLYLSGVKVDPLFFIRKTRMIYGAQAGGTSQAS